MYSERHMLTPVCMAELRGAIEQQAHWLIFAVLCRNALDNRYADAHCLAWSQASYQPRLGFCLSSKLTSEQRHTSVLHNPTVFEL